MRRRGTDRQGWGLSSHRSTILCLVAGRLPAIAERAAQGFALPSRSVPRKASSCHQGPATYTSGQSHAHQSQSLYDRSPHYHQTCHDYGADAGDCDDYDGEAAVHIDRAHTRLAACDALYSTQAPTTPACKALTCCPARHCPAAPTSGADGNASRFQRAT